MIDTRRLRYFLAIVDAGSLTRAAVTLGVAQPALSQQLAALEAELEVKLLERSSTGVTPTAAGEALVRRGRAILGDLAALHDEVGALGGEVVGTAVVGLAPTAALSIGAELVARTVRELPRVRLRLEETGSTALGQALASGLIDLAIMGRAPPGMVTEVLYEEPLRLVSGRALPARIAWKDLAALDWIVSSPPNAIRSRLDAAFAEQGLEPRIVAEVNSLPVVVRALEAGLGVSLLPLGPLQAELAAGRLHAAPFPGGPVHTVRLCRRDAPPSRAAAAVAEVIRQIGADRRQ